jgi:hypothetical protein
MRYGIPNAYNFGIMTLYRCTFNQFYYLDRVHSLYFLKTISNGSYFITILLNYVKYATYNIVFLIVLIKKSDLYMPTSNSCISTPIENWTHVYMNLFTQNSPYYHLLKYLLFLLKHPVCQSHSSLSHITFLP